MLHTDAGVPCSLCRLNYSYISDSPEKLIIHSVVD